MKVEEAEAALKKLAAEAKKEETKKPVPTTKRFDDKWDREVERLTND